VTKLSKEKKQEQATRISSVGTRLSFIRNYWAEWSSSSCLHKFLLQCSRNPVCKAASRTLIYSNR